MAWEAKQYYCKTILLKRLPLGSQILKKESMHAMQYSPPGSQGSDLSPTPRVSWFSEIGSVIQGFFEAISSLKINLAKSGLVGINVDSQTMNAFASLAGCQVLQWPLTYLDIPLGGNPHAISFWDPVVHKISKRLDCWKGAYFSLGGRIILIQSCLFGIPL